MTTIFWAGDSTVQFNNIYTYPQTGIGQVMPMFLKRDVKVDNRAVNGRSTKSFIDEFRVAYIYDNITEGDFLFIQFGHNDEKINDPSRYTRPDYEFIENLGKFVNVARNKKAYPVFITPLERRCFDENGILGPCTHEEYTNAMIRAGKLYDVPVIDLTSKSREALIASGVEASKEWYMHLPVGKYENYPDGLTDNTHLKFKGALKYAGLIAEGLKELGGIYEQLLETEK